MDKEELEEIEKWFDDNKPVLDRLSRKETTHEDWEKFIKLIEDNHCKNCKYRKELEEVEKARMITVEVPDSWIIKDDNEEQLE